MTELSKALQKASFLQIMQAVKYTATLQLPFEPLSMHTSARALLYEWLSKLFLLR